MELVGRLNNHKRRGSNVMVFYLGCSMILSIMEFTYKGSDGEEGESNGSLYTTFATFHKLGVRCFPPCVSQIAEIDKV